jgi:hypothetical protein
MRSNLAKKRSSAPPLAPPTLAWNSATVVVVAVAVVFVVVVPAFVMPDCRNAPSPGPMTTLIVLALSLGVRRAPTLVLANINAAA